MSAQFRQKSVKLIDALLAAFPVLVPIDGAAIAGNGGHESGGFATLQEIKPVVKGSLGGYGWFQWTGPRRRAFLAWCKRSGLAPASDEANIGFLIYELKTTEAHAIPRIKAASTLEAKVKAFELAYERAGVKHYASRINYARQALAAYQAARPDKVPLPRPKPTQAKVMPTEPAFPVPDDVLQPVFDTEHVDAVMEDTVVDEPKSLMKSTTIWASISTFAASGAGMVFAYINSWYGVVALAIVVLAAAWIIRERLKHRKEAGI